MKILLISMTDDDVLIFSVHSAVSELVGIVMNSKIFSLCNENKKQKTPTSVYVQITAYFADYCSLFKWNVYAWLQYEIRKLVSG